LVLWARLWVSIDLLNITSRRISSKKSRHSIARKDSTRRVEDSFPAAVLPEFVDSTQSYSSI
jgi:hypothetical protein